MTAEIIVRPKVVGIPADRLRHLIAEEEILALQIVSHPKRLGLARVAKRANGGGRVIANDRQNAAPKLPRLRVERFSEVYSVRNSAGQHGLPDRIGRRSGSRQKRG